MCFVKCVMLDMGVDVVCVMWEEHKSSELYFNDIQEKCAVCSATQCKVQ